MRSRSNATSVVSDDITSGWIHDDVDVEMTPRDTSVNYNAYLYGSVAPSPAPITDTIRDRRRRMPITLILIKRLVMVCLQILVSRRRAYVMMSP